MTDFDPIGLEIMWSRLISIANQAAVSILRTSFSTIVRESNDFATVLMDGDGNSLAENTSGIASFMGTLPRTLKHLLAKYPLEEWRPPPESKGPRAEWTVVGGRWSGGTALTNHRPLLQCMLPCVTATSATPAAISANCSMLARASTRRCSPGIRSATAT